MLFVKAIFGNISIGEAYIREGGILPVEDSKIDWAVKNLEKKGVLKIFKTYEEAEAFEFVPASEQAAKCLIHLNPPVDKKGNVIVPDTPLTVDFDNSLPIAAPVTKAPVEEKDPAPKAPTTTSTKKEEVKPDADTSKA